ncbi:capsular polysaccharide biosynthesis protein [Eubacteriales bacterium]|nr:capsular polysaccharide biosynthesis protein [Eubacteriales bacterium]GKH64945.1 capsular polysaccharide biosynthesis protein [Eubacteriales bacterium]
MRKDTIKLAVLILVLCCGALGVFAAASGLLAPEQGGESSAPAGPASSAAAEEPAPPPDVVVRLRAVGDNLIHDSIYRQAAEYAGGNGFDFGPVYEHVAPLVADADLSFINQETIIAERLYPLSGYPMFNSPEAVGRHMAEIGFDVVSVANNHMFDMGEAGLAAALDFWEGLGVDVFGAWRTEAAMEHPVLTECHGITFGWVPMTEHTNGLSLPASTEMRYIRTGERELMKRQIELAREAADFVIVVPHWGTEYSLEVNDSQLELAQWFADLGVDLVIGSHPHTLQPIEWRTGQQGHRMLVAYSLGNFVGSMLYPQNMLGGMLDLDITKDGETGETSITRAELIPTVIHYEGLGKHLRTYPFSEYTGELAAAHGIVQLAASYDVAIAPGAFSLDYMRGIIKKNVPEEFRPNLPLGTQK